MSSGTLVLKGGVSMVVVSGRRDERWAGGAGHAKGQTPWSVVTLDEKLSLSRSLARARFSSLSVSLSLPIAQDTFV